MKGIAVLFLLMPVQFSNADTASDLHALHKEFTEFSKQVEQVTAERNVYKAIAEGEGYLVTVFKDGDVWKANARYKGKLVLDHKPIYDKDWKTKP